MPDALNPCEDVMGSHWLRGSVWVVVLLAVFGNVAVLVVLFSNRYVCEPTYAVSTVNFSAFGGGGNRFKIAEHTNVRCLFLGPI